MNPKKNAASVILLAESLLLFSLAFYMIALGFTHDKAWLPYLSVIGFASIGGVALTFLSMGVRQNKRWANSPAILANLIAIGVAKYQFEAGLYFLSVSIALMSITVIIFLLVRIKNSTT